MKSARLKLWPPLSPWPARHLVQPFADAGAGQLYRSLSYRLSGEPQGSAPVLSPGRPPPAALPDRGLAAAGGGATAGGHRRERSGGVGGRASGSGVAGPAGGEPPELASRPSGAATSMATRLTLPSPSLERAAAAAGLLGGAGLQPEGGPRALPAPRPPSRWAAAGRDALRL